MSKADYDWTPHTKREKVFADAWKSEAEDKQKLHDEKKRLVATIQALGDSLALEQQRLKEQLSLCAMRLRLLGYQVDR